MFFFKNPFYYSGIFGNSASADDGTPVERDERQRDFTELRPKAHHEDICGRRFIRQSRIVGGGIAAYGEWPWQVIVLESGFEN